METEESGGEVKTENKYYIDTVNLKVPRAEMEVKNFRNDCMSMRILVYTFSLNDICK